MAAAESLSTRTASVSRKTNETDIAVSIDLDGTGNFNIATGIGFLDHMLEQLSKHSLIDMDIKANGDLHIDDHHTAEDTGIALGQALSKAMGDRRGINRYASLDLPMDETLTRAAIDVSGRPYLIWRVEFSRDKIGTFDTELFREFFMHSPKMPELHCISRIFTAKTIIISPKPVSRLWQEHCEKPLSRTRVRKALFHQPKAH